MESASRIDYNMRGLLLEAQNRWLKPVEVLFLLQNVREHQYCQKTASMPPSGSVFFYNKRVLRYFRQDGIEWRKKKDRKIINEAHERLKVGNVDALNCYYAHGECNPYFQRRSYWMLNSDRDNIVLVHYLDVSEAGHSNSSTEDSGLGTNTMSTEMGSQCLSSGCNEQWASYDNSCISDSVIEVNSDASWGNNQFENPDIGKAEDNDIPSPALALRKLAAQLSLEDYDDIPSPALALRKLAAQLSLEGYEDEYGKNQPQESSGPYLNFKTEFVHDRPNNLFQAPEQKISVNEVSESQFHSSFMCSKNTDSCDVPSSYFDLEEKNVTSWNDMLELAAIDGGTLLAPHDGGFQWTSGDVKNSVRGIINHNVTSDENGILPSGNDVQCWNYFEASQCNVPVANMNKFKIREISPEWAYSTEITKVIITGDFLHVPESSWAVMFGDIEVPAEIIQQGVLRCWAPQHSPGTVKLSIISGTRETCSEPREFSYLVKPDTSRSPDELLILVKFVQTILYELDSTEVGLQDGTNLGPYQSKMHRKQNERLDQIMEAVLQSSMSPSSIIEQLLEELARDKLLQWSERKKKDVEITGLSSKHEFCILHMLSGLGYEWALKPVLDSGVAINFRDVKGWTALHWAARFGREKMVATLLAAGALPGAVTDPTQQNPLGKTPSSIATEYGHKGLSGYLAEAALTSHLSSLKMGENENCQSHVTAEETIAVQNISEKVISSDIALTEDELSLKDSLGAVMNATQAAARIQSAFRAHSFIKKQKISAACLGNYGMTPRLIHDAMSNHLKPSSSAHNQNFQVAALCIQKKFRGWKGRQSFLNLRRNVVKIQAHVRGHQVRKKYRFSMTVSILEKAILRWRRKGVGLRMKLVEPECGNVEEEDDEEEVMKVFRRQKVDDTVKAAVSRVLSMVESPEARQQYRRMLGSYQQAKAELNDSIILTTDTNDQMDDNYPAIDVEETYCGGTFS